MKRLTNKFVFIATYLVLCGDQAHPDTFECIAANQEEFQKYFNHYSKFAHEGAKVEISQIKKYALMPMLSPATVQRSESRDNTPGRWIVGEHVTDNQNHATN